MGFAVEENLQAPCERKARRDGAQTTFAVRTGSSYCIVLLTQQAQVATLTDCSAQQPTWGTYLGKPGNYVPRYYVLQ